MSSEVLNRITMIGVQPQIDELLEKIRADGKVLGSIDFNKITPMPESLNLEYGSESHLATLAYLKAISPATGDFGVDKFVEEVYEQIVTDLNIEQKGLYKESTIMETDLDTPDAQEYIKLGKKHIDNLIKYGATTWYHWCRQNWGTKWNASNCNPVKYNTIVFSTAYSKPTAIIYKLADMYPYIRFNCAWADEALGRNVGRMAISKDLLFSIHIPEEGSKEAYEMSAQILEIDLNKRGLYYSETDGTYIRKKH